MPLLLGSQSPSPRTGSLGDLASRACGEERGSRGAAGRDFLLSSLGREVGGGRFGGFGGGARGSKGAKGLDRR